MKNSINHFKITFILIFFIGLVSCGESGQASKEEKMSDLIERAEKAKRDGDFNDPYDYHQAIVGLQTEIASDMLNLENEESLKQLRKTIKTNIKALGEMSFSDEDFGLKSTMLNLFSFYLELSNNQYPEIIELSNQMEGSEGDEDLIISLYSRYMEIMKEIEEEELPLSQDMLSSQDKFTDQYNLRIEVNPLQEDIDKANAEFESIME